MWQLGALVVHPLRRPVWQRPCARVLGLDSRVKPLSGGDGRWEVALREVDEQEQFGVGGAKGGVQDLETTESSTLVRAVEQMG
jgi:hypothetical protein